MKRLSLVKEAHAAILRSLQPGEIALDATVGNGHDTQFLAEQVGTAGHVYGFDIQVEALTAARLKLEQHDLSNRVTLIHDSHAHIAEAIPKSHHGTIKAVMFNLGYLPGSDKSVITQTESTLAALNAATEILAPKAVLTVLAYPGHAGGDIETGEVQNWARHLDSRHFSVNFIAGTERKSTSPSLIIIEKIERKDSGRRVRE